MTSEGGSVGGIATAVTLFLLCAPGCGERDPETRFFIERLGSDTLAVESVRWSPDRFEGTAVVRSPETRLLDYWGVRSEGRMVEYGFQWRAPSADPERPPLSQATVSWVGDTAVVTRTGEEGVEETRMWSPPDAVPVPGRIPPPPLVAWAPVGAWIHMLDRLETRADPLLVHGFGATAPPRAAVRPTARWGDDSVGVRVIDGFTVARLDAAGRLASISGHGTTVAIDIEPATTPLDLERLALEYARRDERGEGLGVPSPGARMEVRVGGATLVVTYGRPARRGRAIWGGLVPYGEVWRTGANLATHFETDRDLLLGDTPIPAGRYTLWSLVEPSGARLIVNRQTDVWGTQYAPEEDLARIPMERELLEAPVERFTIEIAGEGPRADAAAADDALDGVLAMSWDRTRFRVSIRVP